LHWHDFAYRAFSDRAQLADQLAGATYSASAFVDGVLHGCLCVGPINEPLRFAALSTAEVLGDNALRSTRQSDAPVYTAEPVVCACFQVELAIVRKAIACGEASTVAQIGRKLRAGTNCGSCITELKRLIHEGAEAE
jgi:assimilatory nitrate reductase catalytic subunit